MLRATALLVLGLAAPAAPFAGDDGWVTVRNEMGTVELSVPPGFTEVERKKDTLHINLLYSGEFKSTVIRVFAHPGYTKPEHIKDYMKFVESDVGGAVSYEDGSTTRFTTEKTGTDGTAWVTLAEGRVAGGYGIYLLVQVPKDVYAETKDTWTKVWDSFKTTGPVPDNFEIPGNWKVVKNDMYVVVGPVAEVKDPKLKQKFEDRLFRVQTWLDPQTSDGVKMFREFTSDARKYPPKQVVRVLPTPEAFQKEAGAALVEGSAVAYVRDHKDRMLVVDGSPDAALDETALVLAAGAQYMDSRLGKMPPWLRAAVSVYFDNGLKRKYVLGVPTPEMVKRGKELFGGRATSFEELQKRDEAGMAELGEPGRVAAWGILQCGLHGDDAPIRNMFRKYMRDGIGAPDLGPVWDKVVAGYHEETKRKFKPRDLDAAAKKYFKEMKEEKK